MAASRKKKKLAKKVARKQKVTAVKPALAFPTVNASQFAKLIGVSVETVSNLADAGMPCVRGTRQGAAMTIVLADALPFAFERLVDRKNSQRDRLATAQAEKFELENGRRRGELLLASDVAALDMTLAADFAARLDGIPGRLANELAGISDPTEVRRRLLEELRSVRAGFADAIRKLANTPPKPDAGGADMGAATEPDGGPVGGSDEDPAAG